LREETTDPFKTAFKGLVLGSKGFINRIKKKVVKEEDEVPATRALIKDYSILDILDIVSQYFNVDKEEIKRRRRNLLPRKIAMYLVKKHTTSPLKRNSKILQHRLYSHFSK
jgi:chromosomal replication initiation ATPase DnaA